MARTYRWKCCARAAGYRSRSCSRIDPDRAAAMQQAWLRRVVLHMPRRLLSSRRHAALLIAALTGCALLAPLRAGDAASAASKAAAFDVEKLARIDDYFNNEVGTGKIPGAMV